MSDVLYSGIQKFHKTFRMRKRFNLKSKTHQKYIQIYSNRYKSFGGQVVYRDQKSSIHAYTLMPTIPLAQKLP